MANSKAYDSLPGKGRRQRRIGVWLPMILTVFLLGGALLYFEMRTSRIQAWIFSAIDKDFTCSLGEGASPAIRFPDTGPYDVRLGYVRIPEWTAKLKERGFAVAVQARCSPAMIRADDWGIFPIYREKDQAGIRIEDWRNRDILCVRFPHRIYSGFDSIPPIAVRMLLFIENRRLLDESSPYQNPAIEWKRLGKAVFDELIRIVGKDRNVVGGSTLATQIEKFRHSPGGITVNAKEKLRQIVSASLRSYRESERTMEARRQIVVDYINSIPLAAAPGFGEVNGLGDGLWAWYKMDFAAVNRLLAGAGQRDLRQKQIAETGKAIKATLSLFIAQRRPSGYLLKNRDGLERITDNYLKLLAGQGLISPAVRNAALNAKLHFAKDAVFSYPMEAAQRKAANFIRSRLSSDLDIKSLYDLDRLDLTVGTTIDMDLQRRLTRTIQRLEEPRTIDQLGLKSPYLLNRGNPANIIYSFSLYEQTPKGNMLRVQTNNYDGPFNVDDQMKLDLGSSAKLRTLVHYLQIITALHTRYAALRPSALARLPERNTGDRLTCWAIEYLRQTSDRRLSAMLSAAMDRKYSASPAERFFTGGGMQVFVNFHKADNFRIMSVSEAFYNSVNLVFIRLMRDITNYQIFMRYGVTPHSLEKLGETERKHLLSLFADKEGKVFIARFYNQYQKKTPQDMDAALFSEILPVPGRLAVVYRYLNPDAPPEAFIAFLKARLPDSKMKLPYLHRLYRAYDPGRFSLADIGYIAHIHPLELWVVKYLRQHPDTTFPQVIDVSADERQEVYRWLFKTKNPRKQSQRIRTIIELEAFQDIYLAWKRVGYPFDYLVPSYATAIGSSADRPGALAELIGIILNNGIRRATIRVRTLHFAKDTPYETVLIRKPVAEERVLAPEAAEVIRKALIGVVEEGTARRLHGGVKLSDNRVAPIGGKTGTGDHRFKTFGPGGRLIRSEVVSRSATFVFFIGDRFFGTMTAYVTGKEAADYEFTSSLPVQLLKLILPDLKPLLEVKEETLDRG